MLFTDVLAQQASKNSQRTALTFFRNSASLSDVTYAALHVDVLRVAAALRAAGLRTGDVVLVAGEHDAQMVGAFLGAMYAGCAPAITAYPDTFSRIELYCERLRKLVQAAGAAAVLIAPQHAHALDGLPVRVFGFDLSAEPGAPPMDGPVSLEPMDAAYVQFSSGTTGMPKAALVSHGVLMRSLQRLVLVEDVTSTDVIVGWLPLHHDFGLIECLLLPLCAGVRSVLIAPQTWVRRPRLLLEAIHVYRGTIVPTPNFGLVHTTEHVREKDLAGLDLSSLRLIMVAAELVQEPSARAFEEQLQSCNLRPGVIFPAYGMAECVLGVTLRAADRPLRTDRVDPRALIEHGIAQPSDAAGARAVVSCGAPIRDTSIEIVDEAGRPLPERRVGEIVVSTDALFSGYIGQPERTARALQPDGLHTGDLGYLADGELFVLGRMDGVIIVAGKHVLPEGLEEIALEVAGEAAGRAAAFGVFDERLGLTTPILVCEIRGAFSDAEATQLAERIRAQVLLRTDVSLADVRLVRRGWIPVTTSGKVRRSAAAEKYASMPKAVIAAEPATLAARLLQEFAAAAGQPTLALHDDLYDAGLQSLRLLQQFVRVEQTYGCKLNLAQLVVRPTVQEILNQIESRRSSAPLSRNAEPARNRRTARQVVRRVWERLRNKIESKLPYRLVASLQWALLSSSWVQDAFWRPQIELLREWHTQLGDVRPFREVAAAHLRATTLRRYRLRKLARMGSTRPIRWTGDVGLLESSAPLVLVINHTVAELDNLAGALSECNRPIQPVRRVAAENHRLSLALLPQLYAARQTLTRGGICLITGDGPIGPVALTRSHSGLDFKFRSGAFELAFGSRARLAAVFGSIASNGAHTFELVEIPMSAATDERAAVADLLQRYSTLWVERFTQNYAQWPNSFLNTLLNASAFHGSAADQT